MEPLEKQLTDLIADQKVFIARADTEFKSSGAMHTETKAALDTIRAEVKKGVEKLEELDAARTKSQTQLDAIDAKIADRAHGGGGGVEEKSLGQNFIESKEFLEAKERGFTGKHPVTVHWQKSAFPVAQKANITTGGLGSGSTGILMPSRLQIIPLPLAVIGLRVRDLMTVRKLEGSNSFDWLRQTTRTNAASPQVEAATKAESTYAWDAQSSTVKTLAHFVNVSRQAIDDASWLRGIIDDELLYGLKLKEEQEILSGSGVGEHLNGIITQATAYDSGTYNVSGDTKLDKLRHAKLQARLLGLATFAPDGMVVHPTDMHTIELIKDQASNVGNYVVGDPKTGPEIKTVWGLPVVESDSIAAGTFLVGAFARAAVLIDRMAATLEISYEHASNFTANLATILIEERLGMAVMRPTAFVTGSY